MDLDLDSGCKFLTPERQWKLLLINIKCLREFACAWRQIASQAWAVFYQYCRAIEYLIPSRRFDRCQIASCRYEPRIEL
jgi:hypothetical protein